MCWFSCHSLETESLVLKISTGKSNTKEQILIFYMTSVDCGCSFEILIFVCKPAIPQSNRGRCDPDHMVVRFTTTYAISTYHH